MITQFRTLVVLEGHDVTPCTVLLIVDRLIAAHLVTRQENTTDRRELLITLTHEGARLVAEVTFRRRAQTAAIVAAMSQEGRPAVVAASSPKPPAKPHPVPTQPPVSAGSHAALLQNPIHRSLAPPAAPHHP